MKKNSLFIFIFISILFVTISYGAFNTNLLVNGKGIFRAKADVRISGILIDKYYENAIENFNPNYNVDTTTVSVNLPTENSKIRYHVKIKNYGNKVYIPNIEVLSEVNENVIIKINDQNNTYILPSNNILFELNANEEKIYTLEISNKNGTINNNILVNLKYNYVYDEVTNPVIGLSNDEKYIELIIPGTSTFGVNHYEYYISETNTSPQDNTLASGIVNNSLKTSDINYSSYNVWYRTVSNKGTKSVWSNNLEVIREVKITYVTNSQSICSETTALKGDAWGTLCNPIKEDYLFEGWYLDNNTFTNKITSSSIANSNITVYAHWIEIIYVAEINGTYYESITDAINDYYSNNPNDENEITIRLLKNTSELIKIDEGRNIKFDLQNFTLSNIPSSPIINNYGIVKIYNGIISTNANQGAINVYSTGTFKMTGGKIESSGGTTGRQAIYNDGGIVEISGGSYLTSNSTTRAVIQNQASGKLYINGGTIISTAFYGIENRGNMEIGIKDGIIDKTNPLIQGVNYGIYANNSSNIKYYDGVIKGKTAINNEGRVIEKEENVSFARSTEIIDGETYKVITLDQAVLVKFNPGEGTVTETSRLITPGNKVGLLPNPNRTGYIFEGWFTEPSGGKEITSEEIITSAIEFFAQWTDSSTVVVARIGNREFHSLASAISTVNANNIEVTIELARSIKESIKIPANKNIKFDLKSYTLTNRGNNSVIENSGTITIYNGTINSDNNVACINNLVTGTLNIIGGNIIGTGTRQAVYNYGTLNISGNAYLSSKTTGTQSEALIERGTIQNLSGSTATITGGTIIGINQQAISNEGTLIVGIEDQNINTNNPIIRGKNYGIKNIGTLEFYDGILLGMENGLLGTITTQQSNTIIKNEIEIIDGKTYKSVYLELNE